MDVILHPIVTLPALAAVVTIVSIVVGRRLGGIVACLGWLYVAGWSIARFAGPVDGVLDIGSWLSSEQLTIRLVFSPDDISLLFSILIAVAALFSAAFYTLRPGSETVGRHALPLQMIAVSGLFAGIFASDVVVICLGWGGFAVLAYAAVVAAGYKGLNVRSVGAGLVIPASGTLILLAAFMVVARFGGGVTSLGAIPAAAYQGLFWTLFTIALVVIAGLYPLNGAFLNSGSSGVPEIALLGLLGGPAFALYLILRLQGIADESGVLGQQLVIVLGVIGSLAVSIMAALRSGQDRLALTATAGIGMLIVASGATGSAVGIASAVAAVVLWILAAVCLAGAGLVLQSEKPAGRHRSVSGLALLTAILGAGVPFSAGFVAKLILVGVLFESGQIALAVAGVLAVVLPIPAIIMRLAVNWSSPSEETTGAFSQWSPLLAVIAAVAVVLGIAPAFAFALASPATELVLGSADVVNVSGWGIATSNVFYYSSVGVVLAAMTLAALALVLFRKASRRTETFNGGEASAPVDESGAFAGYLSATGYERTAGVIRHLVDPEAMYSLISGGWIRLTSALGVAFRVIEDRYYIGAVFLLILGAALFVMR